jgi:hypothetical protein
MLIDESIVHDYLDGATAYHQVSTDPIQAFIRQHRIASQTGKLFNERERGFN